MGELAVVQAGLFDMKPVPLAAAPEPESATVRRTKRQAALLARGRHPLQPIVGVLFLHKEAAPADDRAAAGLRCGSCQFRELVGGHARSYPKCMLPAPGTGHRLRDTMSDASDVRAWWPACTDYQSKEPAGGVLAS